MAGRRCTILLAAALAACGRASPSAPGPPAPSPSVPPAGSHPVSGAVFYDEDGDGAVDEGEEVRLSRVVVAIGGRSAETGEGGLFTIPDAPAGVRPLEVRASSLPAAFRPGRAPLLDVPLPAQARVPVPVVLPIGSNRPHVYLAFGDSITAGEGSRGGRGYRAPLQARLRTHWGRAEVLDDGLSATRSDDGAARIGGSLAAARPAFVLIHYGTNDWNIFGCRGSGPCPTVENLRAMVRQARAADVVPVLGTLVPANPARLDRLAEQRNAWIEATNAALAPMARAEGALVADLHAAFVRAAPDLSTLFVDHVHPNDAGYAAMAEEFFRAITEPAGAAAAQEEPGRPEAAGLAAGSPGRLQRPRWVGQRRARASARR